jgi:hypothetical protein
MAAQQVEQEAPNRTMWQEEDQQMALSTAVAASLRSAAAAGSAAAAAAAPVVPSVVDDGLASDESDAESAFDAEEMAEAGAMGMEGGGDDDDDSEGGPPGGLLPAPGPQQELPDDFPIELHKAHRELNYYHVRTDTAHATLVVPVSALRFVWFRCHFLTYSLCTFRVFFLFFPGQRCGRLRSFLPASVD